MSEETLFEKLGVKYIEKDGIFYPLITLGGEENSTDVGKYGRMWMDYIQNEYPQRYRSLVRFGELHDKATEVNEVAIPLTIITVHGLEVTGIQIFKIINIEI